MSLNLRTVPDGASGFQGWLLLVAKAVASLLIPAGHLHERPQMDSHLGERSLCGEWGVDFPFVTMLAAFLTTLFSDIKLVFLVLFMLFLN